MLSHAPFEERQIAGGGHHVGSKGVLYFRSAAKVRIGKVGGARAVCLYGQCMHRFASSPAQGSLFLK